jgi:hypothetical protein
MSSHQTSNSNNLQKPEKKPEKRFKNVKEKRKQIQKIHAEPSATFLGGLEVAPFAEGTSISLILSPFIRDQGNGVSLTICL